MKEPVKNPPQFHGWLVEIFFYEWEPWFMNWLFDWCSWEPQLWILITTPITIVGLFPFLISAWPGTVQTPDLTICVIHWVGPFIAENLSKTHYQMCWVWQTLNSTCSGKTPKRGGRQQPHQTFQLVQAWHASMLQTWIGCWIFVISQCQDGWTSSAYCVCEIWCPCSSSNHFCRIPTFEW
jgi:hypothetical protein